MSVDQYKCPCLSVCCVSPQVAAYCDGRDSVSEYDCLLLEHVLWQEPEHAAKISDWLLAQLAVDDGMKQVRDYSGAKCAVAGIKLEHEGMLSTFPLPPPPATKHPRCLALFIAPLPRPFLPHVCPPLVCFHDFPCTMGATQLSNAATCPHTCHLPPPLPAPPRCRTC